MSLGNEFYNEDDAQKILQMAARHGGGGMTHSQLVEAAAELGIPPEAITQAAESLRQKREEEELRQEFRRKRRRNEVNEWTSYFSTCLVCCAIWFFTTKGSGYFWPMWVAGPWGVFKLIGTLTTWVRSERDEFDEFVRRRRAEQADRPSLPATEVDAFLESLAALGTSKLEAIKEVRQRYGTDLKGAKDLVVDYERRNPGSF
ncbi:MAG: hypothetical protein KIS66_05225 [Fimbriimonadaceae bacterium]|nr:hypothetical protein [Fimbriimonadaceae bacterium]